jgi:hypothetical protein
MVLDAQIPQGDILTDDAPFTFPFLNASYRTIQMELANNGAETYSTTAWIIGIPAVTIIDPEARLYINDQGCQIVYPGGGAGTATFLSPQLPTDLLVPTTLWERQTQTTNPARHMGQAKGDFSPCAQRAFLCDWMWETDSLVFRGANQVQDVKMRYEKHLPLLTDPSGTVPIRGVDNAAAYEVAKLYTGSRGGTVAPWAAELGTEEISKLAVQTARRQQHTSHRRQPYSGRGSRNYF